MKTNAILIRESDGQEFHALEINHWSLIVTHNTLDYKEDRVKWYGEKDGSQMYVGHSSGESYKLTDRILSR